MHGQKYWHLLLYVISYEINSYVRPYLLQKNIHVGQSLRARGMFYWLMHIENTNPQTHFDTLRIWLPFQIKYEKRQLTQKPTRIHLRVPNFPQNSEGGIPLGFPRQRRASCATSFPPCIYDTLRVHQKESKKGVAGDGFDPSTSGLWAQHASTAPPC